MAEISFIKMHGIGNDFVIVDVRDEDFTLENDDIVSICDRHLGVGCDQFVVLKESDNADIKVVFYNPDGSESGACGNATRCVAYLLMAEEGKERVVLETKAGLLECSAAGDRQVKVNMGNARTDWQDIPLAEEKDTLHLEIGEGDLQDPVAMSMGNPHAVFFVDEVDDIDLESCGPVLETHKIFPEKANVGVAEIISKNEITLRVWERGAGETQACGSGACAAAVAAVRRGLTDNTVTVHLPGGDLDIEVGDDLAVTMTGPVAVVFTGTIDSDLL